MCRICFFRKKKYPVRVTCDMYDSFYHFECFYNRKQQKFEYLFEWKVFGNTLRITHAKLSKLFVNKQRGFRP